MAERMTPVYERRETEVRYGIHRVPGDTAACFAMVAPIAVILLLALVFG